MPSSTTSLTIQNTMTTAKRHKKTDDNHHHHHSLLPGLPDHIAQLCLSLVPLTTLASVCRSWRRLIYSPSFPPSLSLYTILYNPISNSLQFSSFDPISSTWQSLPPPPPLSLLLRHPSYISRYIPIQSVSISGNLVLLAATTPQFHPALPSPLIYNPISNSWHFGPPMINPRRWCAAGVSKGVVVIASGIGTQYTTQVARSVHKWVPHMYDCTSDKWVQQMNRENSYSSTRDPRHKYWVAQMNHKYNNYSSTDVIRDKWVPQMNIEAARSVEKWVPQMNNDSSCSSEWVKMRSLKDGKFCREAIDAIGWKNKLLMVNVKGDAAKEGVVYNVSSDTWQDMPEGMLSGWKGPAAAMNEEILYVVDESKGVLKNYDEKRDLWEEIVEDERLIGAQNLVAAGGKVCVVCAGGIGILVVDVVASLPRIWVVDTPVGFQAVAIHILPRMSRPES